MEEKVDIVALGELLIDFTEAGHSQDGRKLFEQNPGGAPANLLTVASHFGYHTSFIGKVDRKSTRLNSSHTRPSRMPSSA